MATRIRLARGGSKKRPVYRIVVTDQRNPRDGNFIEKLGTYSPLQPKDSALRFVVNTERAAYWIKTGATPTDAILKHFIKLGLVAETAKAKAIREKATVISQAAKKVKDDAAKAESDAKAAELAESKAAEEAAAKEAAQAADAEAKAAAEAAASAEATPEVEVAPAAEAPAEEAKTEEAPAA